RAKKMTLRAFSVYRSNIWFTSPPELSGTASECGDSSGALSTPEISNRPSTCKLHILQDRDRWRVLRKRQDVAKNVLFVFLGSLEPKNKISCPSNGQRLGR